MSRKVKPEEYMNYDKCIRDDTNTSDAVSREAVLLAVCTNCEKFCSEQKCRKYTQIANLPSVQPTSTPCEYAEDCKKMKFEPCEDAVNREAVLGYVHRILNQGTGKKKSFEFTQKYVERLPSVTPKQRTGKWIKVVTETDSFGNETYHHECSVCKCKESGWGEYRFCPDCGAKMEGESE